MARRWGRVIICGALIAAVLNGVATDVPRASALFSDAAPIDEDLDAAILPPPVDLALVSAAGTVTLSWTPAAFPAATAIQVLRGIALGGPYSVVGTVAPAATGYVESPGTGSFYYVVQTVANNWVSVYSNEVNTVFTALSTAWFPCTAQAADTGGDNNGYETNSASSCGDDNVSADDVNSGTGTSTSCTNTGKDRHRFSNFGLVLPTVATIRGVEVRTQSWLKSATTGTNKLCVQVSTDAGVTWTTALTATGLTATEKVFTFGSTSNLWGRTFLTTQFTDALFRVRVINTAKATTKTFALDTVEVRVTYSCPCV